MGSAIALVAGLGLTLAVFLLLPEYRDRLQIEQAPLLAGLAWALALALCATASFTGEMRHRPWARPCQLALLLVLAGMSWHYWPA